MSTAHRLTPVLLASIVTLTVFGGCGSTVTEQPRQPADTTSSTRIPDAGAPPVWQLGDRWIFEWTSGTESGTKTVEVLEARTLHGTPYYVTRNAGVESYYTRELQWAFAVRESKVQSRMIPPQPWFVWPLEAGHRWTHRGSFEDGRGTASFVDTFTVVGAELVDVPAGRFNAVKVERRGERGDADEYWYAPEVRWYVRWVGRRGDTQFEERLRSYDPAPRRPVSATTPSTRPAAPSR